MGILDWYTRNYLGKHQTRERRKVFRSLTPWTLEEERLLGTDTDAKIALRLGRTWKSVFERRRYLGILGWRMRNRLKRLKRAFPDSMSQSPRTRKKRAG